MLEINNNRLQIAIRRASKGLTSEFHELLIERYQRIFPVLLNMMRPNDIYERNRTWPGIRPEGRAATHWISGIQAKKAQNQIKNYAAQHNENDDELWKLFYAYCRYGPIGLIEALPNNLSLLIPTALQEFANFIRLAKHPRSDAGTYIRELLNDYADQLGLAHLPPFVARYAFTSDRKLERWFVGEKENTAYISKTTRRLNTNLPFEQQCWEARIAPLPLDCRLAHRHPIQIQPWICWIFDILTETLMGFRICSHIPTTQDILLCFRWAVWHFNSPWWPARGAPDILLLPPQYLNIPSNARRSLHYLHCVTKSTEPSSENTHLGLPDSFFIWINSISHTINTPSRHTITISELTEHILDHLQDMNSSISSIRPPALLVERGVSLPWENGIAATELLPSAQSQISRGNSISLFDIPFKIVNECNLPEGQIVKVYYDPDDARWIYMVPNGAYVYMAEASAFEHKMAWIELISEINQA